LIECKNGEGLSVCFIPDKNQILESIKAVKQQLLDLRTACQKDTGETPSFPVLFVCWNGKSDKVIQPDRTDDRLFLCGKEYFLEASDTILKQYSVPHSTACLQWLRSRVAPASEIPKQCTTRTQIQRDNSAKLTRYFLDYDQELAASLDLVSIQAKETESFSLRLINGVAGSGKTLIIASRILMFGLPHNQILILHTSANACFEIEKRLSKILPREKIWNFSQYKYNKDTTEQRQRGWFS
jgi:hypothetical protein